MLILQRMHDVSNLVAHPEAARRKGNVFHIGGVAAADAVEELALRKRARAAHALRDTDRAPGEGDDAC